MTDLELFSLLIVTIIGSIVSSLLGWADSGGAFDVRKFVPSALRAAVAAIVVFVGTTATYTGTVTLIVYILAFLAGMGIDAAGNRIAGAITGSSRKTEAAT